MQKVAMSCLIVFQSDRRSIVDAVRKANIFLNYKSHDWSCTVLPARGRLPSSSSETKRIKEERNI